MNKKPVAELEGAKLDYWVARALGYDSIWKVPDELCGSREGWDYVSETSDWNPSENWYQGGPIIEREHIGLYQCEYWPSPDSPSRQSGWAAAIDGSPNYGTSFDHEFYGQTPLIAAMKAFVASKFGDFVDAE
jgi:hypothetical protein